MVYEIKKGVLKGKWIVKNNHLISQPSFLKTEIVECKISFEFSVDMDHVMLYGQKTKIKKDFVE